MVTLNIIPPPPENFCKYADSAIIKFFPTMTEWICSSRMIVLISPYP